jgi:nicotinamide riboside transporter PnuC
MGADLMIWSYLLATVGILGIWLAGRRNLWGWALGVGAQVLWIIYALVTDQYGFIVSALAYAVVYARNWYRWRKEEADAR